MAILFRRYRKGADILQSAAAADKHVHPTPTNIKFIIYIIARTLLNITTSDEAKE